MGTRPMAKSLLAVLFAFMLPNTATSALLASLRYDTSPDCMGGSHPDTVAQEFVGVNGTSDETTWCFVHGEGPSPGVTGDKYTLAPLGNDWKYTQCTYCDEKCTSCKVCREETIPSAGTCANNSFSSSFLRVVKDLPAQRSYSVPTYLYQSGLIVPGSWLSKPLGCFVSQMMNEDWTKQNSTKKGDAVFVDEWVYEGPEKKPKCEGPGWVYVTSWHTKPPQLVWTD